MSEYYLDIPKELQEIDQWVVWEYGGDRKIPMLPRVHITASPTNHKTWTTFEDASSYSRQLGFVLTDDDVYVVIDFDHCVEDGVIHPNVVKTMTKLSSYAEFSPSGTGVHVWVKGTLDKARRKKKDGRSIEIYASARYITVTGKHIEGTPTTIHHRQDELDEIVAAIEADAPKRIPLQTREAKLSDDEVLDLAMNAKNGEKFRSLWSGDTSAYDDDHSAADFALCNLLWYWTNHNEAQVDRLFRRSGLMRAKWDAIHGAQTYGELTIMRVQN